MLKYMSFRDIVDNSVSSQEDLYIIEHILLHIPRYLTAVGPGAWMNWSTVL